jgi:RNAse (barnase) inhibitor barstar
MNTSDSCLVPSSRFKIEIYKFNNLDVVIAVKKSIRVMPHHIKYKHAGMARNFIQNKADITQYYVNRAKRDDEKSK